MTAETPEVCRNLVVMQLPGAFLKLSQTAFLNEKMEWVVEKRRIDLLVGASGKDIRERTYVDIRKDAVIDERTRGFYASVVCDK